MTLTFKRATRAAVPLKLGITGPSGAGKTTAALKVARGLVGPDAPIAFLDTENGSASLYANLTQFDVLDMNPPYAVAKFMAAISAAVEGGYKALVIDSATHEWKELLAEKEALDARGGNSYTNWASITKKHEEFLKAIRTAPIHLILCLRSKEKHEIQDGQNGKKTVVKLGQGSEMRDGFEYELTTVWDIAMDHNAKTSKDRTQLFDGRIEQLTEFTGRELAQWLASGRELAANTGDAFNTTQTAATATYGTATPAAPVEPGAVSSEAPRAPEPDAQAPEAEPLPARAQETLAEGIQNAADERRALAAPVSADAEAFAESVSPTPIDQAAWEDLEQLLLSTGTDRGQLKGYCIKKGWLLPNAQGFNTLSAKGWETLRPFLATDRLTAFKAHLASHHAAPIIAA